MIHGCCEYGQCKYKQKSGCEHRPVNSSKSWKWFVVLWLRSGPCATPQVSGWAQLATRIALLCIKFTNIYTKENKCKRMHFLQILNIWILVLSLVNIQLFVSNKMISRGKTEMSCFVVSCSRQHTSLRCQLKFPWQKAGTETNSVVCGRLP